MIADLSKGRFMRALRETGFRAHYEMTMGELDEVLLVMVASDTGIAVDVADTILVEPFSPRPRVSVGVLNTEGNFTEVASVHGLLGEPRSLDRQDDIPF